MASAMTDASRASKPGARLLRSVSYKGKKVRSDFFLSHSLKWSSHFDGSDLLNLDRHPISGKSDKIGAQSKFRTYPDEAVESVSKIHRCDACARLSHGVEKTEEHPVHLLGV